MDKAKTLPVSQEALARILEISGEEFSTLFEEKDGTTVPIEQTQIDKLLYSKFDNRVEKLKSVDVDKIKKEAEGMAKRLAFKEIEDEAKNLGIQMNWSQDKFSKISDHFSKSAKSTMTEDEIKRSPVFQSAIKDMSETMEKMKNDFQSQISQRDSRDVRKNVKNYFMEFFTNEENKHGVNIPKDKKIFSKNLDLIIDSGFVPEGLKLGYQNDKPVFLAEDGKEAINNNAGYQPYDTLKYMTDNLKNNYFGAIKTDNIQAPDILGDNINSVVKTKGPDGKDQPIEIPKFKNVEDLMKWTDNASRKGYSMNVIEEANKQLADLT